jgi:hypothetical protein
LIDGIEKSASCHECDGASDARVCTRADFAIRRNCMADNRLNSPDRQPMVTLTDYRSRPLITAREVTDGKKRLSILTPKPSLL